MVTRTLYILVLWKTYMSMYMWGTLEGFYTHIYMCVCVFRLMYPLAHTWLPWEINQNLTLGIRTLWKATDEYLVPLASWAVKQTLNFFIFYSVFPVLSTPYEIQSHASSSQKVDTLQRSQRSSQAIAWLLKLSNSPNSCHYYGLFVSVGGNMNLFLPC